MRPDRRRSRIGASMMAGLLLVSAGSAARASAGAAGAPDTGRPARPSLFISPFGQPFRAGPGEPYPVAQWFAQADRNGDGRIDQIEFLADAKAFFESLDTNHDGVIDGFELSNYEHNVVPEILGAYRAPSGPAEAARGQAGARNPRAEGGGPGEGGQQRARGGGARSGDGVSGEEVMGGAAPYELLSVPEPVASADADLTGRVTLADFLAAAKRRFERLDAKGQGYLTLADLPKTPYQLAAEGKPDRKHKP